MLDFSWLGPDALWALGRGAATTLILIIVVTACGTVLSVAGAAVRRGRNKLLRQAVGGYVELIRNTPFLVQLFFIFFGLPSLGVRLNNLAAAALAMTLNMAAYGVEIMRAGLDAVPKGQWEAADSLGLTRYRVFVAVIMPQALRVIFPALSGQIVITMLESAVVSQIAVRDLTYEGDILQARTFRPFETYLVVTGIYFLLATMMQRALHAGAVRWLFGGRR
jgi:polar amino acid transport system permease protein